MATTKTLAPTNQTITIAAFQGEKPDQKQVADAESKLADAVNALNSKLIEYTTMTNGTELNSLTAKANYMVGNIAQMGHAPTGCGSSGFFYVDIKSNYILQRFFGNLGSAHRFSYDGGSNWVDWSDPNNQIGKTRLLTFGNATSITVDLGYTPTTLHYGTAFLFCGNRATSAIFNIGSSPSATVISGDYTYATSVNGQVITITPSDTLWGCTMLILAEHGG